MSIAVSKSQKRAHARKHVNLGRSLKTPDCIANATLTIDERAKKTQQDRIRKWQSHKK